MDQLLIDFLKIQDYDFANEFLERLSEYIAEEYPLNASPKFNYITRCNYCDEKRCGEYDECKIGIYNYLFNEYNL